MQYYISIMFLGLPDDIHEEKLLFLQFKKNATNRPTDGPSYRDARTYQERHVRVGEKSVGPK